MTLLFDLSAAQPLRSGAHGGGEYAKSVFARLIKLAGDRPPVACYDSGRERDPDSFAAAEQAGVKLVPFQGLSGLEDLLRSGRYHRFMSVLPYDYHELDFGDVEVVITIHGLRAIEMPTDIYEGRFVSDPAATIKWLLKMILKGAYVGWRKRQFAKLLRMKARKLTVIVPSLHTRDAVLKHFPQVEPAMLKMLHSPETIISRIDPSSPDLLTNVGLERERYILMVSGGRWVKNTWRGLQAVVPLLETHPAAQGMKVALVGGAPQRMPAAWERHVVQLGRVTADELARCYADAFCLLYPTLNEGFGYPPLESMARGTPVLCSAVTSTPEVLGDAALFFPPTSVDEMRVAMRRLLEDDALRSDLIERGRQRYELMSNRQDAMLDELCRMLLEE